MNNTIIIYCVLTLLIFYVLGKISYKLNLIDLPGTRKLHIKPTAYTGGIILGVILLFSIFLFDIENKDLNLILSISFIICLVGFIDDKYNLNAGNKLILQIFPASYLIIIENLNLTHLGDYNYFKLGLGAFTIPASILSVLFLINAFNYFDGIDGLLSFSTISVLFIIYFLVPDKNVELFIISLLIPICFFLCFNFSFLKLPKLFLGDSGSLLLGFIISFLLIYLAKQKIVHPIILAWSISVFVYEFISINLIRLLKKKNLLKPTTDHLHDFFLKKTKSIYLTNFFVVIINIFLFMIGYLSFVYINPVTSFILFPIFFIIFLILRYKYFITR